MTEADQQIRLCRDLAAQLRRLAMERMTPLSGKLLELAQEFDDHAVKLQKEIQATRAVN
ncbi:MAG TPA: hypothetical protein VLV50_10785 [Stellaceae bacterium]|nr:hypothetical protein [Stellaceae bacterium]